MKNSRSLIKEVPAFFLILAFFFGVTLRIFPLLRNDFPLVDGGMFYAMTRDLLTSNFKLPIFTSYNQANIPFAYPPLGFYLAGFIYKLTNLSILRILQWLPAIITIINIPIFYILSKNISGNISKAALATLIFSLTPNSYWWNIVGGGLTRSLGTLLFTATVWCVYQMYQRKTKAWVIASIIGGAGTVLSHPFWALEALAASLILWWFFGRDKQGTINSAVVAAGVLLLTSPWWITVLKYHGVSTLLHAGQAPSQRYLFWTVFFALSFTGEYAPVIAVFGVIGFFVSLAKKDYFPIAWVLICLLVDPRGGLPVAIFPFSMMAATAITDGIALQIPGSTSGRTEETWINSLTTFSGRMFFGFFILLFFYNAFLVSNTVSHHALTSDERNAIEWVKTHTNPNENFLIFDEQNNPLLSPISEWFPALAERRSIATIQGSEWLPGEQHYRALYPKIIGIHGCLNQTVECLNTHQAKFADSYDYIIVSSILNGDVKVEQPLLYSLKQSDNFTLVYTSQKVDIFKRIK